MDAKKIMISLEFTPNPNTLKYVVEQSLIERGAANFTSKEATQGKSPLAERLFGINGVAGVMVGKNFVTVTKGSDGDWESLNRGVNDVLQDHLSQNLPIVDPSFFTSPSTSTGTSSGSNGAVEDKIREILEKEVRPAVAMDGGDITFDRYQDGVVYLNLQGSCSGCPSSTATLKMGIETRLREAIPEIREVVSV